MADEAKKPHLIQKMAEIVRAIDHVEKAGRNEFHKYNYVRAADVAWVVRKALSERNVLMVADVVEVRNYEIPAKEGVMQAVDVKMQFSFFDGDAPETPPIVLHACGTGADKGDKAIYKAMTGAMKYGMRNAFLVPDDSDPEADGETDKETAKAAAKAVGAQKVVKAAQEGSQTAKKAITDGHVPALFFTWHQESQTATITGDQDLKKAHRTLLMPLWDSGVGALVANADQLDALKYECEKRNIILKALEAA